MNSGFKKWVSKRQITKNSSSWDPFLGRFHPICLLRQGFEDQLNYLSLKLSKLNLALKGKWLVAISIAFKDTYIIKPIIK